MSRQPDFSSTPPRVSPLPRGGIALVAVALALAAAAGSAAYRARVEAADAKARVAEARRQLEAQQARLRAAAPAAAAPAADAPPRRVVSALADLLPADARLARLTIDYEGGTVSTEMLVEARRAASWDRFLDRIEGSPDFAEVEPGPERRDAEVLTTVRARWAGGGR